MGHGDIGAIEFLYKRGVFVFKYIPLHNAIIDKSKIKNKSLHLKTLKAFRVFCFLFTKLIKQESLCEAQFFSKFMDSKDYVTFGFIN